MDSNRVIGTEGSDETYGSSKEERDTSNIHKKDLSFYTPNGPGGINLPKSIGKPTLILCPVRILWNFERFRWKLVIYCSTHLGSNSHWPWNEICSWSIKFLSLVITQWNINLHYSSIFFWAISLIAYIPIKLREVGNGYRIQISWYTGFWSGFLVQMKLRI